MSIEKEQKEKLDWSKLTQEQKEEFIKLLAEGYVKIQKRLYDEMVRQMRYDIFTPFWVKWMRNKIQGGNK